MAKILQIFFHTDMRNSHDGLRLIAAKEKVDLSKLERGSYVLFINSRRTHLKMFACDNVLAFMKLNRGQIDLRTIARIPQAFQGSGRIDYDATLKKVLLEELGEEQ